MKMIPFPHIIHTLRYPQNTQKTFKTKHPFHTFYEMGRINPPFCVYTLPHNFAFSNPPFHTQIWMSWLLHFFLNPPPRALKTTKILLLFSTGFLVYWSKNGFFTDDRQPKVSKGRSFANAQLICTEIALIILILPNLPDRLKTSY